MSEEEKINQLTDDSQTSTEDKNSSELSTTNRQLQTENMEIHKHPKHVTHKKKWTEYLLEFFMLFLAVFLGFVAENWREHIVEGTKEKEYIRSMIEDLQKDTSQVARLSNILLEKQKSIDSIFMYYEDLQKGFNPVLYRNLEATYGYPIFIYTDRTIQQLKNSGGMRLIKNKRTADGIMNYDAFIRNYENNDAYVQRYWEFLTFQRISIIDKQTMEKDSKSKTVDELKLNGKSYLLINDPATLGKFRNSILELQTYHQHSVEALKKLFIKAVDLIVILQKEYHLKNE
jgi:hypothetical protein